MQTANDEDAKEGVMNMNTNENSTQVDADAAEWLVELRDPENDAFDAEARTTEREVAFLDWSGQSPGHTRAFANASRTFDALDKLSALEHIDVRQLINDHSNDVIPLYPNAEYVKATSRRSRFPTARSLFAAAACLGVLAVGVTVFWTQKHSREYLTAVGEQRTIRLDDGSIIHLNTDSQVKVNFSQQTREIDLLKGEALFEVVHNANRPFIVNTGTATVRDVGTKFDVYKHPDSATTVAVVDGAVQVTGATAVETDSSATATPISLTAGEEASVASGLVVKQSKPDVTRAVAWRDRTLSFSGSTLAEVADEFNRYNKVQIRIEGDAVRERQLSGVFSADHPQSVILFLAKDESLSVIPEGESWVIRAR